MKSDKWTDSEWVTLIANGYIWNCPDCGIKNTEIEWEDFVECWKCEKSFRVEDIEE